MVDYEDDIRDLSLSVGERTFLFNALDVFAHENSPRWSQHDRDAGRRLLDKLRLSIDALAE